MSTLSPTTPTILPDEPIAHPSGEAQGRYEIVDGKVVEKPRMGVFEAHITSLLSYLLSRFVYEGRLGRVESEMLFALGEGDSLNRRPDLAFVSYGRWGRDRAVPRTAAWRLVPDLAIEVVSPSNGASEVQIKIGDYFQAGVSAVWVVYPNEEVVYSFRSLTDVTVLTRSGTLETQAVLPGFRLPLELLFEQPETAE